MRSLVLASMLMVVGIVVLANLSGISAQFDCGGDLQAILSKCYPFFAEEGPQIPPSQECCGALKNFDVPCFCQKYVRPPFVDPRSVAKFISVARTCGCLVPSGLKCGSYTVPPGSPPMPEK